MKRLNAIPEVRAIKLHQGRYGIRGTPDLLVVARGRAALLEIKTGDAVTTPSQTVQMALWRLAGALCAVVRSVDEAEALVGLLLEREV